MLLTSNAFAGGSPIPRRFTCEGEDLSPPLEWSGEPAETNAFALLCDDPDAPAGTWHHWAVYDIPPDQTGLSEGIRIDDRNFRQAINDSRRVGYSGPCPPHGHGRHRYHFRLLALSIDRLPLSSHPSCQVVEREARRHVLAEATLIGTYERA